MPIVRTGKEPRADGPNTAGTSVRSPARDRAPTLNRHRGLFEVARKRANRSSARIESGRAKYRVLSRGRIERETNSDSNGRRDDIALLQQSRRTCALRA